MSWTYDRSRYEREYRRKNREKSRAYSKAWREARKLDDIERRGRVPTAVMCSPQARADSSLEST